MTKSLSVPVTVKRQDGSISSYHVVRKNPLLATVKATLKLPKKVFIGSGEDVCLDRSAQCTQ